jgi:hypothetical protein
MTTPCRSVLIEQYEALRRSIVEASPLDVASMGAILVVKTGVAGWMREWMRMAAGGLTPSSPPPGVPEERGWRNELTMLLAQITVRHLCPVS